VAHPEQKLLAEERRRKIIELLHKEDRVTVTDLVRRFQVSAVTARSDLDALSRAGALVRSHGGAIKQTDAVRDYSIKVKETLQHAEKERIGHAAAQLVRPEQTIILDSGTTTLEIARSIKKLRIKPLTVITNALNIAMELGGIPDLSIIMLGGMLRPTSYSLVGPQAEQNLRDLNADHLFLGVDAMDPDIGPSTPDLLEAQLNALMIKVSRETSVVADATKFERRSLSVICKMSSIHRLITDAGADPGAVAKFRAGGLDVLIAK
jgi:DeoR family transcriptional regulator of aga operon